MTLDEHGFPTAAILLGHFNARLEAAVEAGRRANGKYIISNTHARELLATASPPQTRIVDQFLMIRFQGAEYPVPFAEIGQHLAVVPAVGQPGVFVFPDGWSRGTSASASPVRNPRGTRRSPSKPMPAGTGAIAREKRASSYPAAPAARPATPPARLRNRKPGKAAWAGRAIHVLPLPVEPSAPEQKTRVGRTDSGNRCSWPSP